MVNDADKNELTPVDNPGVDDNEPDLFSRLVSDWRNIALIVVTAIAAVLLVMKFSGGDPVIAMVGGKAITEKTLVNELKQQAGDQTLIQMLSEDLYTDYANQKHITVTDADIDQFLNFQRASLEMRGQSLDKMLVEHGQSMADLRKSLKFTILQIKLLVSDEDIKTTLAKYGDELALPLRYQFRDFTYVSEADAKKAEESFTKPGGLQEGASTAINAKEAMDAQTVPIRNIQGHSPAAYAALKALKPGDFSAPVGMKDGFHILQLVAIVPEEKATLENRGTVIGQQLLSAERQKYQGKVEALKADALYKVDTQIISPDYPKAHQMLQDMRLHNPEVGGKMGGAGAPSIMGAPTGAGGPTVHVTRTPGGAPAGSGAQPGAATPAQPAPPAGK